MIRRRWVIGAVVLAAVFGVGVILVPSDDGMPAWRDCTGEVSLEPPPVEELDPASVELERVSDLTMPTNLVSHPVEPQAAYVTSQAGGLHMVDLENGTVTDVLQLPGVSDVLSEGGLIGLAVDPDATWLYLYWVADDFSAELARWELDGGGNVTGDKDVLLAFDQPHQWHNGGQLLFGPDGYLYIGLGDGGGLDPETANRAQDLSGLFGKILRIDPRPGRGAGYSVPPDNPFVGDNGAAEEIWLYGLRNPWRFAFSPEDDELWIAEVGQFCFEEINRLAAADSGLDMGWPHYEGFHEFFTQDEPGTVPPVYEYPHDEGCAVVGGAFADAERYPEIAGQYVFSDACSRHLRSLSVIGSRVEHRLLGEMDLTDVSAVVTNTDGSMYVLSLGSGIHRVVDVR